MKIELYRDECGWQAFVDCDCGTTLSGGHTVDAAGTTFVAERALGEHLARRGEKCGTRNHCEVDCKCDECRAHNEKLGKLVTRAGTCKSNDSAESG